MCAGLSAEAAQFLNFAVRQVPGGREIQAAGATIVRLRSGQPASFDLGTVADSLNDLALSAAGPSQVKVTAQGKAARIVAQGQTLLVVDAATAAAARNTPLALANSWAANIRRALATPYATLQPADSLLVPYCEARLLRFGGPAADKLTFTTPGTDIVTVKADAGPGKLTVYGVACGKTTLTATLPGGDKAVVDLAVRMWAATLPDQVTAQITAPPLPEDDLRRVLRNAVLANVKPAPDAEMELTEPTAANGRYTLGVRAGGKDLMPVAGEVAVSLQTVAAPATPTRELLISNLPERIVGPAGLLRERLLGTGAVRLLWHHVNRSSAPLRFVVRLANLSPEPAQIHITDAASGPNRDEIFVGHSAMVRFLKLWEQGEGYTLTVPGGRMLDLYDVRLTPDWITSGLARITPLVARNLVLEVVAENTWPTDAYFLPVPKRLVEDPPLTPYRFEAEKNITLSHDVAGPWTFYHVGKDYSENLQGFKLMGDYGVLYRISATFKNPTQAPGRCEIGLRASGGVARATLVIDGEMLETGLLQGAREQIVFKATLQPGEEKKISIRTVPESGSNYPITLVMRSWQ